MLAWLLTWSAAETAWMQSHAYREARLRQQDAKPEDKIREERVLIQLRSNVAHEFRSHWPKVLNARSAIFCEAAAD